MTFWFLKFFKKTNAKIWLISALESKKWLNQKDKGTLLYVKSHLFTYGNGQSCESSDRSLLNIQWKCIKHCI